MLILLHPRYIHGLLSNVRLPVGRVGLTLKEAILTSFLLMSVSHVQADSPSVWKRDEVTLEPLSMDCKGISAVVDGSSSSPCRVYSGTVPKAGSTDASAAIVSGQATAGITVSSVLEFDTQNRDFVTHRHPGVDLSLVDDPTLEIEDIHIHRVSTSLSGSEGTLTVGKNWSNFQDFLPSLGDGLVTRGLTTDQLSWATRNELGEMTLTLEGNYELVGHHHPLDMSQDDVRKEDDAPFSSSLVVSWRGGTDEQRSFYGISAMGRELKFVDDQNPGSIQETTGWGMNLFGGWRFGELFAALSVTLGNSIDSFILGRQGDRETATVATRFLQSGNSININPALNYRLSENSNLHLSVNRFSSDSEAPPHGVETLDTIHIGYTWTPWPSTRVGIEMVEKDVEGFGSMQDSRKVNIQASKHF